MSELIVGSINVGGGTITGIATQQEAEAGTNSTKLMTPQRTKQAIDELVLELSQEQVEDSTNEVFGVVSGQRLEQQTKAALNATGSAPTFAPRAWVNFDGITTVTVRGSGNVSSVTRNSTGNYTINFATAMPDTNYSVCEGGASSSGVMGRTFVSATTSAYNFQTRNTNNGNLTDDGQVFIAVFR